MELTREENSIIKSLVEKELNSLEVDLARLRIHHACQTPHYKELCRKQRVLIELQRKEFE